LSHAILWGGVVPWGGKSGVGEKGNRREPRGKEGPCMIALSKQFGSTRRSTHKGFQVRTTYAVEPKAGELTPHKRRREEVKLDKGRAGGSLKNQKGHVSGGFARRKGGSWYRGSSMEQGGFSGFFLKSKMNKNNKLKGGVIS